MARSRLFKILVNETKQEILISIVLRASENSGKKKKSKRKTRQQITANNSLHLKVVLADSDGGIFYRLID